MAGQGINLGNFGGPFHGNIRPNLIGNANFRIPPPTLPFNAQHNSNYGRFGYEPVVEVKSGVRQQHQPPPVAAAAVHQQPPVAASARYN